VWPLQGFDIIGDSEAHIIGAMPVERTALVGVQHSLRPGFCEKPGCYNPSQDFHERTDENDYLERGEGLIGGLSWLVKYPFI